MGFDVFGRLAGWQSDNAAVCKAAQAGSVPALASESLPGWRNR